MTGKWDALIAEADTYANDDGIMGMPASPNAVFCDLIARLAAALREAQAHVPPEGWRVTEWTQESGAWITARTMRDRADPVWQAYSAVEGDAAMGYLGYFPTVAAAMAEIEGSRK